MRGTIYEINQNRGMVAVLTEDGDFSVFSLLGGDPVEKGDKVQWQNDTGLGSELLTNLTQVESYQVCFEEHQVAKHLLRQHMLY
ncbi:MAG: hypothetical protein NTW80_14620 [Deltaproteobacteria bacterium]|nr:hypothetical protein [Deltaproteobacteria bacterium]